MNPVWLESGHSKKSSGSKQRSVCRNEQCFWEFAGSSPTSQTFVCWMSRMRYTHIHSMLSTPAQTKSTQNRQFRLYVRVLLVAWSAGCRTSCMLLGKYISVSPLHISIITANWRGKQGRERNDRTLFKCDLCRTYIQLHGVYHWTCQYSVHHVTGVCSFTFIFLQFLFRFVLWV